MSEGNQDEATLQDEDSSDDGLWNEFESCATSVTHLYRNSNWRTLQSAAASTTQLYKHGLEAKKRSFDRGFIKGRLKLAREISAMCRYKNKIDVGDIVALFSKYDLLPAGDPHHHHHRHHGGQSPRHHPRAGDTGNGGGGINAHPTDGNPIVGVGNPNAVFLFQEALAPVSNPSASPHRNGGLGSFLQNQVCRHRKRSHSPGISSPCGPPTFDIVSKRFKRL